MILHCSSETFIELVGWWVSWWVGVKYSSTLMVASHQNPVKNWLKLDGIFQRGSKTKEKDGTN